MAGLLFHKAGVHPGADLKLIGWVTDNELRCVVGFNGFVGKICSMHVGYNDGWHYTPKELLREAFRYAFEEGEREMVVGIVSSANEEAMRFDLHLGFKEIFRLPGMHLDGDLVVLGMRKQDCRYWHGKINGEAFHGREEQNTGL